MLTSERLRELLVYDPETGLFTWKKHGKNKCFNKIAGSISGKYRRRTIGIDYRVYLASRLAWLYFYGKWPKGEIDHIDTDPTNDRILNLRDATKSQNGANKKIMATNTSGRKGVTWNAKKGKWQAQIKVANKMNYLGLFTDRNAAASAYDAAAIEKFGEFARCNPLLVEDDGNICNTVIRMNGGVE